MTAHGRRAADVAGVAGLRAALAAALADPDVSAYRYWALPELAAVRTVCPCGDLYSPGVVRHIECRCGIVHVRYRCARTGQEEFDPPRHDGCGPLPVDPDVPRRM